MDSWEKLVEIFRRAIPLFSEFFNPRFLLELQPLLEGREGETLPTLKVLLDCFLYHAELVIIPLYTEESEILCRGIRTAKLQAWALLEEKEDSDFSLELKAFLEEEGKHAALIYLLLNLLADLIAFCLKFNLPRREI